jgi:hypothetical protein
MKMIMTTKTKGRLAFAAALLLLAACLYGCVSSRPYQTALAPRPGVDGRLPGPPLVASQCLGQRACVTFVEYDDFGNPFHRGQVQGAVDAASDFAKAGGSVLVYVHGWHNNAANGTRDVEHFRTLVARASELDAKFRPNREGAGRVLGIYVGWRGDSIASSGVTAPLSYLLTFWDRKEAAHQIGGSGGVYELFSRLSTIRRANVKSRLLIHGHSFGGAMVYSTISHSLVDQIIHDGNTTLPSSVPSADLFLLINPAFEAIKLRPQFDLARSQEYSPSLPPRLVVITTEADWATGTTFPIGRRLGTLFASYGDDQSRKENTTAVGHHLPLITHQLAKAVGDECSAPPTKITLESTDNVFSAAIPIASLGAINDRPRNALCIHPILYDNDTPLMLRRCDNAGDCSTVAGRHFIARGTVSEGYVPFRMPILNIRTTADVSGGHSDIRTKSLENFVVQLMVLAMANPEGIDSIPMAPGLLKK